MREVISIHIGKTGVNAGLKTWEIMDNSVAAQKNSSSQESFRMFHEASGKESQPRAVFVDTDEETFESISTSSLKNRIPVENRLLKPYESEGIALKSSKDATEIQNMLSEALRKEAEKCEQLEGLIIYHSAGVGVGSGLTRELLKRLPSNFEKVKKMCLPIFSKSKYSGNILESYNNLLTIDSLVENADANILYDLNCIRRMRKRHLKSASFDLSLMNSVFAFQLSNLLVGFRSDSYFLKSVSEFVSDFVPYPRINLLTSSMTNIFPLACEDSQIKASLYEIGTEAYEEENQFFNINHRRGKLMASSMFFQGENIVPKDICPVICKLKTNRDIRFVDWCPTGFKCGINYQHPLKMHKLPEDFDFLVRDNVVNSVHNSTDMGVSIQRFNNEFDTMWNKRVFLQNYFDEGWEEGEFIQARENIQSLEMDYRECSTESEGDEN